jgi:two-component system sensor histidine kinase KdpD
LLASVSHDLRTPLTAMRGSIDSLLALGEAIPGDRRELLEGTRDGRAPGPLHPEPAGHDPPRPRRLKLARDWVAPADIVGSALNRLRVVLAPLQVPTCRRAAAAVRACADRAGAGQRAGKRRALSRRMGGSTASEGAGRATVLRRQRPGPGIPEDEREKIFDMFYTAARGDRGGQGTGLGLAICQGMIGAHGGRILVATASMATAPASHYACRCPNPIAKAEAR